MLAFLTDAHMSPDVAAQVKAERPEIVIHSVREWRDSELLRAEDDVILTAALDERLTFVTYDQSTIAPWMVSWGAQGRDHAGVIFINWKTIDQADRGKQVRGLIALWEARHTQDWI